MRIIAGSYGGRVIKSPPDRKTRPTSDRLRETLFNILSPRIDSQTRFLDLCAGTGAVGIEALSRGAVFATFVDKSRRSCALIERNLDSLGVPEEQTEIYSESADKYFVRNPDKCWEIIFFDPPYDGDYEDVLKSLGNRSSKNLERNGILVVEHSTKKMLPDMIGEIRRWRVVKQGESSLSFYEKL